MDRDALAVLVALATGGCGASTTPPGPLDPGPGAGRAWRACDSIAASVVDLAYSSDGRWLAAARVDGSVTVADLLGGRSRTIHSGRGGPIRVALTEQGERLAVAGDGHVTLHSVVDGKLLRRLVVGAGENVSLRFSDAPAPLLLAAFDRAKNPGDNIKIWRASDGVLVGTLSGSPRATFTYADEAVLLVDDARGFEVLSFGGRVLRRVTFPSGLTAVAFAPDGAYLGGAIRDDTGAERVAVMSVADDAFLWVSSAPNRSTRHLLFLENPSRVVQLGQRALVYDQADGSVLAELTALDEVAVAVASPDGESLATVAPSGALRLLSSGQAPGRSGPPSLFGLSAAPVWFSSDRDGRRLAIASAGQTSVLDLPEGSLVAAFATGDRARPDLGADGTLLALGGATRTVYRLDGGGKELEIPVAADDLPCAGSVALSPDGAFLAAGGCGRVELFRRDGTVVSARPSRASAPAVAFSPDGTLLATSGPELWTVSDLRAVWPPPSAGTMASIARAAGADRVRFSRDGRRLLVTSAREAYAETTLLSVADGSVVGRFDTFMGPHPDLSPDGEWVVGSEGAVQVATGSRALLEPPARTSLFLPDLRIVGASDAPLVRVFCPDR